MNEMLTGILMYVAAAMGVPESQIEQIPPYTVEERSSEELFRMVFPSAEWKENSKVSLMVQGSYIPTTSTVLLNESLDWENDVIDRSVLLHEVVHHVQFYAAQEMYECKAAKEREAYAIQEAYLKENGAELFNLKDSDAPTYGMDLFAWSLITNCPNPNLARPGDGGP